MGSAAELGLRDGMGWDGMVALGVYSLSFFLLH